jgi:alanine racemase
VRAFHSSQIEISRSALENNIKFIQSLLNEGTEWMSVVKGNAYGHGIDLYVPLAESLGLRNFAVFSAEEALDVLENREHKSGRILIMGNISNEQLEWAIYNDIEFYVFDMDRLQMSLKAAKKVNKKARVHIEIETGMNRTGFPNRMLAEALDILKSEPDYFVFEGLCTHYAGAESIANYYRIKNQMKEFRKGSRRVLELVMKPKMNHTACSAAMMGYPETQMDMVRIGILQYGFFPSREIYVDYVGRKGMQEDLLQRLISWKSRVMDVKYVNTGEFVGYGTSYLANSEMKIATIPVGYSHGYSRSLSNQGRVLIRGQRVVVVGTVNMNMISVDVTHVDGVEKGDEVILIGKQGDMEISVSSFSEFSDQVNYELLTRLPRDIPRVVVD